MEKHACPHCTENYPSLLPNWEKSHDDPTDPKRARIVWYRAMGVPVSGLEVWWCDGPSAPGGVECLGWVGPPTGEDLTEAEFEAGLALARTGFTYPKLPKCQALIDTMYGPQPCEQVLPCDGRRHLPDLVKP